MIEDAIQKIVRNELNAALDSLRPSLDAISRLAQAAPAPDISGKTLLRRNDVQKLLGVKTTTLYDLIRKGEFPKPQKLGGVSVWPSVEVSSWLERFNQS
jgi:prophage regulatory protein